MILYDMRNRESERNRDTDLYINREKKKRENQGQTVHKQRYEIETGNKRTKN